MHDIKEREEIGGFVFGIGADGQGEFAEVYTTAGERIDMHGPDTDPLSVRRILSDMKTWWLSGRGQSNMRLIS